MNGGSETFKVVMYGDAGLCGLGLASGGLCESVYSSSFAYFERVSEWGITCMDDRCASYPHQLTYFLRIATSVLPRNRASLVSLAQLRELNK
jgi:hypothetical protein